MNHGEGSAWTLALHRFQNDLSESEREIFFKGLPSEFSTKDLLGEVKAASLGHNENSRLVSAVSSVRRIFDGINQYAKPLDVYCQTAASILSPIWGSIRVLIHIVLEYDGFFEKIADMLGEIGDALPRYRDYEELFGSPDRLIEALTDVYVDILDFCTRSKAVFRRKSGFKAWLTPSIRAFKVIWKPFELEFGPALQEIRNHAARVEREADVAQMRVVVGTDSVVRQNLRATEGQIQRTMIRASDLRKQTVLDRLSRYDYRHRHNWLQERRHGSTGSWLQCSDVLQSWISGESTGIFWLYGIPGCGKSVATSVIVESLLEIRNKRVAVAYFYCDHSNAESLAASSILGSIIRQLLMRLAPRLDEAISQMIEDCYSYDGIRYASPPIPALIQVLQKVAMSTQFSDVFIIIDGLDECPQSEREPLLASLRDLVGSVVPRKIRIYLSSRDEGDIASALKDCERVKMSMGVVEEDIRSYVKDTIDELVFQDKLRVDDPTLVPEIFNALVDGAQGMFLWVSLQIPDIVAAQSDDAKRRVLQTLPADLMETYRRILAKIGRGELGLLAKKMLEWIVCAKRPLAVEELQEAVGVSPGDSYLDRSKIPTDYERFIRTCGGFVTLDDEDLGTLRLAHRTVKHFLVSGSDESPLSGSLFGFRISDAEQRIGQVLVTYLTMTDFEGQVYDPRRALKHPAKVLESAMCNDTTYLRNFSSKAAVLQGLLQRRGKQRAKPDIEYSSFAMLVPVSNTRAYHLLEYAKTFWLNHTTEISEQDENTWCAFMKLAFHELFIFDFIPWMVGADPLDDDQVRFPFRRMFNWALSQSHLGLLRLLRAPDSPQDGEPLWKYWLQLGGCNLTDDETSHRRLELRNALFRSHSIFDLAIESWPVDQRGELFENWTEDILSTLQPKHADPRAIFSLINARLAESRSTYPVGTLVHDAVRVGSVQALETILCHSGSRRSVFHAHPEIERVDAAGNTPLRLAGILSKINMVGPLVRYGANGWRELEQAVERDERKIARTLVQGGVPVNPLLYQSAMSEFPKMAAILHRYFDHICENGTCHLVSRPVFRLDRFLSLSSTDSSHSSDS